GDTAQVGPQIAEHLNLPSITYAEEIKTEGEYVLVKRQFEDCCHDLKVKMPCLITTLKDMNTPRYMKVGRIYDAFENDVVETWTVKDIEVDPSNLGLKGSPTSVFKSFTKSVKPAGTIYNEDAKTSAGIIIDKLKEKYII
ncbi:electron transfer flavoprotein subunit beta, partial [Clostridioides difficile]